MSKDTTKNSQDDLNPDPDFDPDATIEQSETGVDGLLGGYAPLAPLPETIGKYRILSEIGEGGMGTVYEAEQDSPRRKVALKVIKAGVVSKNLLLRFEIEAQILGKLDHPGIATIFEAGTFDEGQGVQPFFAMEFVQGELLTDYADKHKLGTRDRLGLLAKIADAVQHAHQKGVIHRDLKPGNILVNNEGQIKILDFGVARATDADIQTATMQTDIGQLIGTIPYMSPEQASGNPDDLDTRSDVYALGIIGYELLTGQMPYDVKQKMIHEAVRVIREDEPKTLSSINKTFRGDVEIIVSKALIKEKERRYQSASDLASDIGRYLNNEPIEARPPSVWYQLSKFSRRNKALVIGVVSVLIVSLVGTLISINFAISEANALDRAEIELRRATDIKQYVIEMLKSASPEEALGTDLITILNKASDRLIHGEIHDELIMVELHEVLGDVYMKVGDYAKAELHLPIALSIRTRTLGLDHPKTLSAMSSLAKLFKNQGRRAEAEELMKTAISYQKQLLGNDDPKTLRTMNELASLYSNQFRRSESELLFREVLEARIRVLGPQHPDTLTTMHGLGVLMNNHGQYDEADSLYTQSFQARKAVLGDHHPDTLISMTSLGTLWMIQNRNGDAEAIYRETLQTMIHVLGEDHPRTLFTKNNLAISCANQGKYEEAIQIHEQNLADRMRTLGEKHPDVLISIANIANTRFQMGHIHEAQQLFQHALEVHRSVLGNSDAWTKFVLRKLAESESILENTEKSLQHYRELYELETQAQRDGQANEIRQIISTLESQQ